MIRLGFIFIGLALLSGTLSAQEESTESGTSGYILGTDTIVVVQLGDCVISPEAKPPRFRSTRRYRKIEEKVQRVYPYAYAAGEIMRQYDTELASIEGEKERKAFVATAEDAMKGQFEGDLREMTVSEGILLIKLIDRETGETSYELIQELKGGFNAFMWQSVARLFGHNLKNQFDAIGDDRMIEDIIKRIEKGEIPVKTRQVHLSDLED